MGTTFAKWRIFCSSKKIEIEICSAFAIFLDTSNHRLLQNPPAKFQMLYRSSNYSFLENLPAKFLSHCTGCVLKIFAFKCELSGLYPWIVLLIDASTYEFKSVV